MNYEIYSKRKKEWDEKFKILVEKGGLSKEVYENHREIYCLGYYNSLWLFKIFLQLGKLSKIKESLSKLVLISLLVFSKYSIIWLT